MKKKSVTKILLSVMVLLVSVAFCACGSNKSTESSETGNSSSEKTLNQQQMAHSLTQPIQILPVSQ